MKNKLIQNHDLFTLKATLESIYYGLTIRYDSGTLVLRSCENDSSDEDHQYNLSLSSDFKDIEELVKESGFQLSTLGVDLIVSK